MYSKLDCDVTKLGKGTETDIYQTGGSCQLVRRSMARVAGGKDATDLGGGHASARTPSPEAKCGNVCDDLKLGILLMTDLAEVPVQCMNAHNANIVVLTLDQDGALHLKAFAGAQDPPNKSTPKAELICVVQCDPVSVMAHVREAQNERV